MSKHRYLALKSSARLSITHARIEDRKRDSLCSYGLQSVLTVEQEGTIWDRCPSSCVGASRLYIQPRFDDHKAEAGP